ncbi:amphoterin-induced protein 3-like [Sinocyclocheilus rhinocerous]|nr:PREDICTED: amphoterin-induced protein 3-like [Sinocyclocheilus rhinocerous]XP_016373481.1 PREDICTED: amphoterin-induced protein 3-like [Sinocyclocheilus rhinocerous]
MTSTSCVVLISLLVRLSGAICPQGCLCISDILNCGSLGLDRFPNPLPFTTSVLDLSHNRLTWLAAGSFYELPRLHTLQMSHNRISLLSPGAFHNISSLRYLDLSSNKLQALGKYRFQDLPALEVLLLYNNRLTRVESNTLMGLGNLRMVYFSLNQITDFPFFSIRKHSHPNLVTLDLSSNHLFRLPIDDIVVLPVAVQKGLFLHNNSLECDCSMYRMFWHWEQKGYPSVKDYKDDYKCLMYGEPQISINFLRSSHFFENCTIGKIISLISPKADKIVYEGEQVRLDCTGTLNGEDLSYSWITPHQENISQLIQNGSLRLNQDGSLDILAAQSIDSGVYQCTAVDNTRMINESREVNLTVVAQHSMEGSFNTGYTTLLGCVATLVLILMYLYLTPCRCGCCKPPPPSPAISTFGEDRCTLTSIFAAPSTDRLKSKSQTDRHVVFLEPLMTGKNGHPKAAFVVEQSTIEWDTENFTIVRERNDSE